MSLFPRGLTSAFMSRAARMDARGVGMLGLGATSELAVLAQKLKSSVTGPQPGEPSSKSTIDWWCWDQAGFKDCHALAFQAAQGICQAGGMGTDPICLTTQSDTLAKQRCGCAASPPPAAAEDGGDQTNNLLIGLVAAAAMVFFWPDDTKKKGASK